MGNRRVISTRTKSFPQRRKDAEISIRGFFFVSFVRFFVPFVLRTGLNTEGTKERHGGHERGQKA